MSKIINIYSKRSIPLNASFVFVKSPQRLDSINNVWSENLLIDKSVAIRKKNSVGY